MTSGNGTEAGEASFNLEDDEMELGIGIHGEPGIERETLTSANDIAERLTDKVLADMDFSDSDVVVMVNGLGATPEMELYIVNKKVQEILNTKGITVYRTYVGEYMKSHEMAVCLVKFMKFD